MEPEELLWALGIEYTSDFVWALSTISPTIGEQ